MSFVMEEHGDPWARARAAQERLEPRRPEVRRDPFLVRIIRGVRQYFHDLNAATRPLERVGTSDPSDTPGISSTPTINGVN